MTRTEDIIVAIEKLQLESFRNGAIAEQNRWLKAMKELAATYPEHRSVLIDFLNEMRGEDI